MVEKALMHVVQYAVIVRDGKLLLLLDALNKSGGKYFWGFPGGHIDDNDENALEALKREVFEETELTVDDAHIIGTSIMREGYHDYPLHYAVFYYCFVSGELKLSREHSDYKWVSAEDVDKLHLSSEVPRQIIRNIITSQGKHI